MYFLIVQIRPKLDYQFSLARKMELVDAVQEIAMIDNNNNNEWMSEEYKEILRDQESIRCVFCSYCIYFFAESISDSKSFRLYIFHALLPFYR